MRKMFGCASVAVACITLVASLFVAGCATARQQANRIRQSTDATVDQWSAEVVQSRRQITMADQHVQAADTKLATAATQPNVPSPTSTLIGGARTDLHDARTALGVATKATAPAEQHAAAIKNNAADAASVTATVQTKLDSERNHWIGYKGRALLWWLAGIAALCGVAAFAIKAYGGGAILGALGEIGGNLLSGAWAAVKLVGMAVFHAATLGGTYFAGLLDKHLAQQSTAASKATTGAGVS